MLRNHWNVLIVDDEPDVLAISRVALRNTSLFRLPVRLHECQSKKEAIEWLKTSPEAKDLALGIIDVVMETDASGLELCEHIRKELDNRTTQLVIRTGQAGKAPEREVVDQYDISGYVTKVEATDDRLYSMLKSCVREFHYATTMTTYLGLLARLVPAVSSRQEFIETLSRLTKERLTDAAGRPVESLASDLAYFIGDRYIGFGGYEQQEVGAALRDKLTVMESIPLNEEGDRFFYMSDEGASKALAWKTMIEVGGESKLQMLAKLNYYPPDFVFNSVHMFLRTLQQLWGLTRAD